MTKRPEKRNGSYLRTLATIKKIAQMRIILLCFAFLTLTSCFNKNNLKTNTVELSLYESYNLIELSSSFNDANKLLRKHQLDSMAKIKTSSTLLDAINEEAAKSDSIKTNNFDDFPLFSVFIPNTRRGRNGDNYMDTSTILGWTTDTPKLISYLNLSHNLFPANIKWMTSSGFSGEYKCLYALKNVNKVTLKVNDIDSVIINPTGPNSFGGVFEKMSDLKGISRYRIELKLSSNLSDILKMNSYILILKVNSAEYPGSIVKFKKFPAQLIFVGEIGTSDFQVLKSYLEPKMKIKI